MTALSLRRLSCLSRLSRMAVMALATALGMLPAGPALAQGTGPSTEEVEAAYLHKFAGYIEWPERAFASQEAPLVVGIVGSERMFELLSGMVPGRPIKGRPVEVHRLQRLEQVAEVNLVFVGSGAWKDLASWALAAKGRAVVLTTDAPQGIDHGAVLGFVQVERRVRFEVSPAAAEQAGVRLSSRLLAVAERVAGAAP